MGCRSDYMEPNAREDESRRVAQHLRYVLTALGQDVPNNITVASEHIYGNQDLLDEWTAKLCGLCRGMDDETESRIIYNAREPLSRNLASWWERHQRVDEAREKAEAEAEERARTEPLLAILKANGHNPETMVTTDEGERTALEVLQSQIGHALDLIEGTEEAQIPE